ncbi:MAG: hypothetical protein ACE5FA_06710 [Dehalococcoidia bacterium]
MAKTAVKERRQDNESAQGSTCQHHWSIEMPAGSTSKGRCRRCGEERDFRNSADDYVWEKDSGGGNTPWRGTRGIRKTTADDDEPISVAVEGAALN